MTSEQILPFVGGLCLMQVDFGEGLIALPLIREHCHVQVDFSHKDLIALSLIRGLCHAQADFGHEDLIALPLIRGLYQTRVIPKRAGKMESIYLLAVEDFGEDWVFWSMLKKWQ